MSWLRRQPPGRTRDVAHATLAWETMWDGKFDDAEKMMSQIGDASIRGQMEQTIAETRRVAESTNGANLNRGNSTTPNLKF